MLIINADDWGRTCDTTDRTIECFRSNGVSSVSAMVFMEDSERAAMIAQEHAIETGLGEQQRVALARALVHRPRLVLADEPTGNLDPVTAHQALQLLFAQCARHGITLLMATHSAEAAAAADRRLVLTQDGLAAAR